MKVIVLFWNNLLKSFPNSFNSFFINLGEFPKLRTRIAEFSGTTLSTLSRQIIVTSLSIGYFSSDVGILYTWTDIASRGATSSHANERSIFYRRRNRTGTLPRVPSTFWSRFWRACQCTTSGYNEGGPRQTTKLCGFKDHLGRIQQNVTFFPFFLLYSGSTFDVRILMFQPKDVSGYLKFFLGSIFINWLCFV